MEESENSGISEPLRIKLDAIASDNRSGSRSITERAARLLMDAEGLGASGDKIMWISRQLLGAHGSMASLVNLIDRAFKALEKGGSLTQDLMEYLGDLKRSDEKAISYGGSLLGNSRLVIAYSNSSMVIETILNSDNRSLKVLISEGRPACEGITAAEHLGSGGIPVTLTTDAALFQKVPEADLILVGADSVSGRGIVNKIGTRGLAAEAKLCGTPIYPICTLDKVLPWSLHPFSQMEHSPLELYNGRSDLEVHNPYFDLTPLDRFSGFIAEKGILTEEELLGQIREMELHHGPIKLLNKKK
ncbi:MAG: hypothetical protein ACMUIE_08905 [Thermoplasmatota archaeon]